MPSLEQEGWSDGAFRITCFPGAAGAHAAIERREGSGAWTPFGELEADASGIGRLVDPAVAAGGVYAYRLAGTRDGAAVTWGDTGPMTAGGVPALFAVRVTPNPVVRFAVVDLTLQASAAISLMWTDVS